MLVVALMLAVEAAPAVRNLDVETAPRREAAIAALRGGRPQEAVDQLDPAIAVYEADNRGRTEQVFCGMNMPETLAYMAGAAKGKRGAVALGPGYCESLFLKGYALIDLGRAAEARALYERVVALAPLHAHYLIELGQTYRLTKDWRRMIEVCRTAETAADLGGKEAGKEDRSAALRCQGYALIEQGKFDEAEPLYRKCLQLDPNDAKAKNELQYIADQRGKRT